MSVLDRMVSEEPLIDARGLDRRVARCAASPSPSWWRASSCRARPPTCSSAIFPRYPSAGFFPYQPEDCGPSVVACVEALTSEAFARALGERLGIEQLSSTLRW
jgi:hypothetical protein